MDSDWASPQPGIFIYKDGLAQLDQTRPAGSYLASIYEDRFRVAQLTFSSLQAAKQAVEIYYSRQAISRAAPSRE